MIPYPNAATDPSLAVNETDFLRRAMLEQMARNYKPHSPIEFNASADLIMIASSAKHRGEASIPVDVAIDAGKHMELQLGLMGIRLNPGSSWIMAAVESGWRYKGNGFERSK